MTSLSRSEAEYILLGLLNPLPVFLFFFLDGNLSCFIILCLTMSHKKSSVVCSVPVPVPVCPCVCLWGGPFCCVCLYYPKASKPAFLSSLWPQKPRRCHAQPRLADVVVWVVVVVAVTSILATCRALGIFYKNNLTRFFARTTTMANGNHILSPDFRAKCRPHQSHQHELLSLASALSSLSFSFSYPLSTSPFCSHTLSIFYLLQNPSNADNTWQLYYHCCLLSSLSALSLSPFFSLSISLPLSLGLLLRSSPLQHLIKIKISWSASWNCARPP